MTMDSNSGTTPGRTRAIIPNSRTTSLQSVKHPTASQPVQARAFHAVLFSVLLILPLALPGVGFASPEAKNILRTKGCISCHKIPGVSGAAGTFGPSLKGMSTRGRIVGGMLENDEENLKDWLRNPKSVKPSTLMPNLGLSEKEIQILVEFFDTI